MAMAWVGALARAPRVTTAAAKARPPCRTLRREGAVVVNTRRSNGGVNRVRMRFAPILQQFNTRAAVMSEGQVLGHSWLYRRPEFGYQAARESRCRRIS